jgi:hypothetical protein
MKIIELNPSPPDVNMLLQAIQEDDVLLVRDGHAIVRLEKFDDDDWDDWKYEHSTEAIARGGKARDDYRAGRFRTLPPAASENDPAS